MERPPEDNLKYPDDCPEEIDEASFRRMYIRVLLGHFRVDIFESLMSGKNDCGKKCTVGPHSGQTLQQYNFLDFVEYSIFDDILAITLMTILCNSKHIL